MKIAFVIEHPSARVLKIARALIKEGIEIEVFDLRSAPNYSGVMPLLKEICSEWHEYYDSAQLYALLLKTKASVVHYFAAWGNCGNLCDILMNKDKLPPIIIECYDLLNEFYIDKDIYYPIYKARERYALAHSDGVVFRSYCGDYLRDQGYDMPESALTFLDYFDESQVSDDKYQIDQLSFVYAGGISMEEEYPDSPFSCWLNLADLCEKNKCHLHIYPSVWDDNRFQGYLHISEFNNFFHLHMPLSSNDLVREISRYDYGIMPATNYLYKKEVIGYYYKTVPIYASANKYFDYLCAGLPIISYTGKLLLDEFKKEGMAFFWPVDEYDFELLREKLLHMKSSVIEKRYKYGMGYQIGRLIDYYKGFSL